MSDRQMITHVKDGNKFKQPNLGRPVVAKSARNVKRGQYHNEDLENPL